MCSEIMGLAGFSIVLRPLPTLWPISVSPSFAGLEPTHDIGLFCCKEYQLLHDTLLIMVSSIDIVDAVIHPFVSTLIA